MARVWLLVALACLSAGTGVAAAVAVGDPSPERRAELLYRLKQDCGSCHGLTLKGGLGPPLLPMAIGDRPDDVLVEVIRDGVPGTPMPPWGFELSDAEAQWLVRRLKEGNVDSP